MRSSYASSDGLPDRAPKGGAPGAANKIRLAAGACAAPAMGVPAPRLQTCTSAVPSATVGCSGRSDAQNGRTPVETGPERQETNELVRPQPTITTHLVDQDRNGRCRSIAITGNVRRHLLGRDTEALAHRTIDAVIGLVRNEPVHLIERDTSPITRCPHGLRQLAHRVTEHLAAIHARHEA